MRNIDVMKLIEAGATPEEIYEAAKKAAQEKKEKDAAASRIIEAREVALDAVIKYAEAVVGDKIDDKTREEVKDELAALERFFSEVRRPTPKVVKKSVKGDDDILLEFLSKLGLDSDY